MNNVVHSTYKGQVNIRLHPTKQVLHRVYNPPQPRRKKKIFPHLGASVLVRPPKDPIEALYHPIENSDSGFMDFEWSL